MDLHEGSVITETGAGQIQKDKWAENGVKGGMFRLAFAPISCYEAVVYMQVAPVDGETFRAWLDKKKLPEQFSGVPAIRMTDYTKIRLGPREPAEMNAGCAILPFILTNSDQESRVTLPTTEALRREAAATLRSVAKPRSCKGVVEYEKLLKNDSPPRAEIPQVLWPEVPARQQQGGAPGECHTCSQFLRVLRDLVRCFCECCELSCDFEISVSRPGDPEGYRGK